MSNFQKICVFDLETDGANPEICSPVQIAALMIDPVKLEIIRDSEFNINLKPEKLEENNSYDYSDVSNGEVLDFHAKVKACSRDDILTSWRSYQKQEQGWKLFKQYLDMYHSRSSKKSQFSAPIACGYNIYKFDLRIIERLSIKYNDLNKENRCNLFYPRDTIDLINVIFLWFENNNELKNYTLDSLRDYLGIDKTGAHDALKDVRDTAEILIRFLRLHRNMSTKVQFQNSFKKS